MRHNGGVDVSVAVVFAEIWTPDSNRSSNGPPYVVLPFGVQQITESTATRTSIAPFDWKCRALSENYNKKSVAAKKGRKLIT